MVASNAKIYLDFCILMQMLTRKELILDSHAFASLFLFSLPWCICQFLILTRSRSPQLDTNNPILSARAKQQQRCDAFHCSLTTILECVMRAHNYNQRNPPLPPRINLHTFSTARFLSVQQEQIWIFSARLIRMPQNALINMRLRRALFRHHEHLGEKALGMKC
jgi:hypothetical protein